MKQQHDPITRQIQYQVEPGTPNYKPLGLHPTGQERNVSLLFRQPVQEKAEQIFAQLRKHQKLVLKDFEQFGATTIIHVPEVTTRFAKGVLEGFVGMEECSFGTNWSK